jgi:hypothetical protein
MLGKLARWLRIMGYDTVYDPCLEDPSLLVLAEREGRILLTRDEDLFRRAAREGTGSVLLRKTTIDGELEELSKLLAAELPGESRCPICNCTLEVLQQSMPWNMEATPGEALWRCFGCGKVYWHGSHWKGINSTLSKLGLSDPIDHASRRLLSDKTCKGGHHQVH